MFGADMTYLRQTQSGVNARVLCVAAPVSLLKDRTEQERVVASRHPVHEHVQQDPCRYGYLRTRTGFFVPRHTRRASLS